MNLFIHIWMNILSYLRYPTFLYSLLPSNGINIMIMELHEIHEIWL